MNDWLKWITARAGRSRTLLALSVGEQVLILAIGGELDTGFVMPAIFSGDFPAPAASANAFHIAFPDGAVIGQGGQAADAESREWHNRQW